MPLIATLATAWGPAHGGINTFNADLCKALGDRVGDAVTIACVVPYATSGEVEDALRHRVHLVLHSVEPSDSDTFPESRADEVIRILRGQFGSYPQWWLGHDVHTGPIALKCRDLSTGSSCAIVHHMDYSAYTGMEAADTEAKVTRQRKVLSAANVIFAVGPKLRSSAEAKLSGARIRIEQLIPGLADVSGLPSPQRVHAITFGRLGAPNNRLKQTSLAVAAFGRACSLPHGGLLPDDDITVIGLDADVRSAQHKELLALAQSEAGRAVQVHAWPYLENVPSLLDHVRHASVCLMLSIHEGFGLAGWEAIAAEVPLIVSRNSGVFETVDHLAGGMGTGCLMAVDVRGSVGHPPYLPEDVETVAKAILDVRDRADRAKMDAIALKRLLQPLCTWASLAETVAKSLGYEEALGLSSIHLLSHIGVDRWQPQLLLDALLHARNVVDEAARRNRAYANLWDRMRTPSGVQHRVVLFGGIASKLCDDEAARLYAGWLSATPNAQLFLCYETGEAAAVRAHSLSEAKLLGGGDLPTDRIKRMEQKERRVLQLRERVARFSHDSVAGGVSERIVYVPLQFPLTTYIMVLDEQLCITPVFDARSSDTLTFTLSKDRPEFQLDVIEYMLHHLARNEAVVSADGVGPDVSQLRRQLAALRKSIEEVAQ